jgi:hypothetical protein
MILKSKLNLAQFFDYFTGFLYWFKKGPLTLFELLGPVVYLMLGAAFIIIDPLIYARRRGKTLWGTSPTSTPAKAITTTITTTCTA